MLRKFRRLLPYIVQQWPALAVILLLTTATALVTVLQPWPLKLLIDCALGHAALPDRLRELLATFNVEPTPSALILLAGGASIALFVLNSALEVGLSWAWTAAGQRMVYELAGHLFARLQRLSLLFHSRRSIGDSLDRLATDTWCVYSITEGVLVSPLQQLLTLTAIGIAASGLDWQLTLLVLVAVPLLTLSSRYFGPLLQRRARQQREAQAALAAFVQQTLAAVPIVQVFDAAPRNRRHFTELADSVVKSQQRGVFLNSVYRLIGGLTNTVGIALVLFFGGQRVLSGTMSAGSLLVFVAYLRSMHVACDRLFQTYGKLKAGEASMDRVLEILDTDDLIRELPNARLLSPAERRVDLCLDRVTVGYEPDLPVLTEISLDVRSGETVAFVGPTGAGKSTLVALVCRFLDPWQGRVLWNGVDVREFALSSLRSQIALVLQEPFLLPLTVAENIAYGRPGATHKEIEAAARAASAEDFIRRLPLGYDTVVGERGATLSGGEKQRLAIARALLKDAPVVVLDEPTSALDAGSETQVIEALDRLTAGRTTLIIAHRLSTIRRADRIVVLDRGRIVEAGTERQLLAEGRLYQRLHALQFGSAQEIGS